MMPSATAISLIILWLAGPVWGQNAAATITVDASANPRRIDPRVYGVAYASTAQLADLNVALNRMGGNNTSRYNWMQNADNRGSDWYFESIGYASATAGEQGDTFISQSRAGGAEPMLTIPIIGWVAKLGAGRSKLASFSQAKYGTQTGNDWQWFPDAGNGVLQSTGKDITGNDPTDANVPADATFEKGWAQALVSRWGQASAGGLRYYILDNEHSIWHATHRDVHPAGASMEEIRGRILDYASALKQADPAALVVGPEEWGWSGYVLSGADQQYGSLHGWSYLPDRAAHGNMDYLPWLLDQLRQDGRHLLDVFSVHYYPQGGEFGSDTSTAMQQRRNRSTRSLWDPNYVDETWINDKVQLIPRLRQWADTYYAAGTPIAITEYNWGAEGHINGATAQADILGIFGREGLDMAARWTTPDASTPVYKAIRMYRNYDGQKSAFGEMSVLAGGPNPDNVSVFASTRAYDGALTVMVISKYTSGNTPVTVNLSHFATSGPARVYQLSASNAITRLADVAVSGGALSATVPSPSVTLFVVPPVSRCDCNRDGAVNVVDVQRLVNVVLGVSSPLGTEDVNRDGRTDVVDLQVLVNVVLGSPCPA
ncbi:MAG: cellulase [Bryobacterales bacterium]|nr:cellulase [Bryobacterales bacterium]